MNKNIAIFTLLYNEYSIIERSLSQLRATNTENFPIYAVDNDYPFLTLEMVERLKKDFSLTIIGARYNRGLSGGYNELINTLDFLDYAILYDCDSYPVTVGWDKAMSDVIRSGNFGYLSLIFDISRSEMNERGYTEWMCGEYAIWTPKHPCVQSISCADLVYLRSIRGIQETKKYYGGLESNMFKFWNEKHKLGYIRDFTEIQINNIEDVNPLYREYKWEYAHKSYNGSFDDFIKMKNG